MLQNCESSVVDQFEDDIFEICSAYFPITFKNDKLGIKLSSEDLRIQLDSIMIQPRFLDLTLELIFEKLTPTDVDNTASALDTLVSVIKVQLIV